MSTTYPTPTFNWATLGGNATANLQAVPLQQLNSGVGYPLMQGTEPAGGINPSPFGTMNNATAFSTIIAPPATGGRPTWPQVIGLWHASDVATYNSRDMCTLYVGCDSSAPTTITVSSASYTATTMVPSPALTPSQVTFIQNAITQNNLRGPLIPAGYDNIGMMIDTQHSPKYTGAITAVAANGSSVTVMGWYQQGNTAAGQVPANGIGAYVNPVVKMWSMNGVMNLAAGTACNQMTFLEADVSNNQAAFSGTIIPTIGISVNGSGNTNGYGFMALGNWATGFSSSGNVSTGYLIQQNAAANPSWGFLSQVRSDIAGGHHPFGYYDNALATPAYRWSVASNGTMALGQPAYENGWNLQTNLTGSSPVIQAVGPDTNLDVRLVTKGTGMVRTAAPFQSNANSVAIPAPGGYVTALDIQGADNTFPALAVISYGQPSGYMGRRADGTGASPTSLVANDQICQFSGSGYDGSTWSSPMATFRYYADGAWSSTSHPTAAGLSVCAPNSVNPSEQLRMFSSGRVALAPGASATLTDGNLAALTVSGPTSAYGFLSNVASTISGGHHPFVYTDSSNGQNRFTVGSNGSLILGSSTTDNGLSISTAATGSPVVVLAQGPDTNINIRIVAKGTGMVEVQSGLQLSTTGPTWTFGAGAPASTQPVGSLYSNTSGAAGARLYVSAGGGTWTAVAGV